MINIEDLWWDCPKCKKRVAPRFTICPECWEPMPERAKPIEVEPVKPKPTAPAVEPPKPTAPAVEPPKPSLKKRFAWIGGIASVILSLWFIVGNFFPPVIGAAIKAILKLLEGVF